MLGDLQYINDYVKRGGRHDYCYICAKKKAKIVKKDASTVINSMKGHMENVPVLFFKKNGEETCICMDCMRELYEEHILPAIVKEVTPIVSENEVDDLMEKLNTNGGK